MATNLDDNHPLVKQARQDARQFYADNAELPPEAAYDHTYGDARARVLRDGRVLIFDAKGHPRGNPVWDSAKPK